MGTTGVSVYGSLRGVLGSCDSSCGREIGASRLESHVVVGGAIWSELKCARWREGKCSGLETGLAYWLGGDVL